MKAKFKSGDFVEWVWEIGHHKTVVKIIQAYGGIYQYQFIVNLNYPEKQGTIGSYYIADIDRIGKRHYIDTAKIYREVLNEP